jgi:hypothetical protein
MQRWYACGCSEGVLLVSVHSERRSNHQAGWALRRILPGSVTSLPMSHGRSGGTTSTRWQQRLGLNRRQSMGHFLALTRQLTPQAIGKDSSCLERFFPTRIWLSTQWQDPRERRTPSSRRPAPQTCRRDRNTNGEDGRSGCRGCIGDCDVLGIGPGVDPRNQPRVDRVHGRIASGR